MRKIVFPVAGLLALVAAAAVALSTGGTNADAAQAAPPAQAADAAPAVEAAEVVVYKSPTCGCCNGWVRHLRLAGHEVSAVDVPEHAALARIKAEHGVPYDLGSCHTARVGGYTVEGHVPAEVIARLLEERPAGVVGVAVPGMPIGSPGMEGPNPQPYDVIAFREDGSRLVYESVYPSSDTR